jgi:hypothetical protein
MSKIMDFCSKLENKIIESYEDGITLEVAEKLAGEFLHAQMVISSELKKKDLDSRMKKQGVKALRAALYLDQKSKAEKVTEANMAALLDSNELVSSEQNSLDEAEASRDELERYYNIFNSAHVYFRQLSKGSLG